MPFALSSSIYAAAFTDARSAELVSDEAHFRALLEVEAALARAQARLGIIPGALAARIESAAAALPFEPELLARGVERDGVPTLALVAALRAALDAEAAACVHLGATSQDIMDSALVLCLERALAHIESSLTELLGALLALGRAHEATPLVARTHGQHAVPSCFGLKVAGWALPLARHHERLSQLRARLGVVQLGGAAGTLAGFGPRALELTQAVAEELGLAAPLLPWHTQRDNFAELGSWLSLLSGSLGKLAQDVIAMCQTEVGELSEAEPGQRGASSSMPHKNNPMRSEQILAAARALGGHLSSLHHALVQEHERGTHGWQVEWLCLGPMLQLGAGALKNAVALISGLQVDAARMRDNLLATRGLVLSEAAVLVLSRALPRPAAQKLVSEAARRAQSEARPLLDVLRELAAKAAPELDAALLELDDPTRQLGHARTLALRAFDAILAQVPGITR